jgi:hypothetical protein
MNGATWTTWGRSRISPTKLRMGTSRDDQNIVDTKSKADAANLDKMQQIVALTRNLLVRINVFSECNKNTRTILKERP